MPTDPDQTSMIGYVLALIGLGGGGAKFVTHESRLSRLERDRGQDVESNERRFTLHDAKLDSVKSEVSIVAQALSGIEAKIDGIQKSVDRNADLYIARRMKQIRDTGGEVDE